MLKTGRPASSLRAPRSNAASPLLLHDQAQPRPAQIVPGQYHTHPDDLVTIDGKREQLEGALQERYGIAKDEARQHIDDWLDSLND